MARRTRLTPSLHQGILDAVGLGLSYVQACQRLGVPVSTACQWRQRGEATHRRSAATAYVALVEGLVQKEADHEAQLLAMIHQAAHGGVVLSERITTFPDGRVVRETTYTRPEWTASAWLLERKYPERWAKRERVDLHVQVERAAEVIAADLGIDPTRLLAQAQAYLERMDHEDA